jgi:uncharacterized glyoxalase superfamily protein PhnB
MSNEPNIYPSVYYRDAPAAIEWLCNTFGFEKRVIVPDGNGAIVHSELSLGSAFVMVATASDEFRGKSPLDAGCETGSIYVGIDDVAAMHARAKAAGATVTRPLEDKSYGGSGFSVRDPEGHEWHFGSYRLGSDGENER